MDIHKPKAAHSWREFAVEIGTIICGILIALGLEQVVEFTHRKAEGRETRAVVKEEIEQNLGVLQWRSMSETCVQRRLAELHDMLDEWTRTGSFKAPTNVGQPPWGRLSFARFEAAQSAGRLALLEPEEQYRAGLLAVVLRRFDTLEMDEDEAWATLRMLQNGPKGLSEGDRPAIRQALHRAAHDDSILRLTEDRSVARARGYGFTPSSEQSERSARLLQQHRVLWSICLPLATSSADVERITGQPLRNQF